jgi:hypothetical protein
MYCVTCFLFGMNKPFNSADKASPQRRQSNWLNKCMKEGSAKLKASVQFATTAELSALTLEPRTHEENKPRYQPKLLMA